MKKTVRYISFIALASVLLSSCIKETFPMSSTVTAGQIAQSNSALDAAVAGIPTQMAQGYLVYGSQTYENDMAYPLYMITFAEMTGEMYAVGDAGYDHYQNASSCRYYNAERGRESYVPWRTLYMFVKSANDVIGIVDESTASAAQLISLGQAYVYRAFDYFMLTSMYEPVENKYTDVSKVLGLTVPIVTETTTEAEGKNNPRATHDEMIAFILSDLDKAESLLAGYSSSSTLTPSLAVCYGVRAKVLMLDGQYAEAEKYAQKAIDVSGATPLTEDEWENPTTGFNSSNHAWLWNITYSAENMGNLCNFTGWMAGESNWGYASLTGPGMDKALYESIPETDFRKHTFLCAKESEDFDRRSYYDYQTVRDDEWLNEQPDYLSIKFRCGGGDYNDYSVGGAVDVPIMRVEEMYYIVAEAKAHQNLVDGVNAMVDFVKTYRQKDYSFSASTLDDFITEYVRQKKIEFWGEGIAYHDVKRLKTGCDQAYEGNNAPGTNFQHVWYGIKPNWTLCIPTNEMQNNTGIQENNPDPSNLYD